MKVVGKKKREKANWNAIQIKINRFICLAACSPERIRLCRVFLKNFLVLCTDNLAVTARYRTAELGVSSTLQL